MKVNFAVNQVELNTVKAALYEYARQASSLERQARAKVLAARAQGLYRLIIDNIDIRDLEQ